MKIFKPKISVIICTYNRANNLKKCLDALQKQSLEPNDYEIIIVNDGSTDTTEQILKNYRVKIITNKPNKGLAQSRNIGVSAATSEIIAFTDDDCIPDKNWLKNLFKAYSDPEIIAAGGKTEPFKKNNWLLKYYDLYNPLAHLPANSYKLSNPLYNLWQYLKRAFNLHELSKKEKYLFMITGANMSLRRSTYDTVGGFDNKLKHGCEEEDFWIRLNKKMPNSKLRHVPNALIKHDYDSSFFNALKKNYRYGIGGAKLFIKNEGRTPTIYPYPIVILTSLLLIPINYHFILMTVILITIFSLGWIRKAIQKKKPYYIFYASTQASLELANTLGFIKGYLTYILSKFKLINILTFQSQVSQPNPTIHHLAPSYPPDLGGMEKVVQALARTQSKNGKDVFVITSVQKKQKVSTNKENFPISRLKYWTIANTKIIPSLIFKLLRIDRNEIVHLHITSAYIPELVWLTSKLKGFKYIAHLHLDLEPSSPAGILLKIYKPFILKYVLRSAGYVVVFSQDQRDNVNKQYDVELSKIKIIPNGIEEKFYYEKTRKIHKKPRLLFVGRLEAQKNIKQLLNALKGISDKFETTLVGEGSLLSELKRLALSLRLTGINFAGRADGNKLLNYYKQSDIFVLPSEREGMPLALLEASAMGLPIVATDVSGNREVVKSGQNGLLVPYGNPKALNSALLKISSNNNLYNKLSNTSRKIAKQFSSDFFP